MQNVFYEVKSFFRDIFAVIEYELLKVIRAPSELVVRSVQPILWLAIFGEVFARTHLLNDDSSSYLAFLAPGVLAQGTLFVAIFYGIAIIWERDMGILQKMLVTPAPRATIVFGKAFVAGVRSLTQGIVVYSFALLLKIPLTITPTHLGGVIIFIFLGAALFSTFSLIVACLLKTRERFMGMGQVLTMPLFFGSNAIYPVEIMPHWLQIFAKCNPMTYMIDALRSLMLAGGHSHYGLSFDFLLLSGVFLALVMICSWLYPEVVR